MDLRRGFNEEEADNVVDKAPLAWHRVDFSAANIKSQFSPGCFRSHETSS
jgi:hypothetical protein